MSGQEQPGPFAWDRCTGQNANGAWDYVTISESEMDALRSRFIAVDVARLAEFEAFVRQIREEVAGGKDG